MEERYSRYNLMLLKVSLIIIILASLLSWYVVSTQAAPLKTEKELFCDILYVSSNDNIQSDKQLCESTAIRIIIDEEQDNILIETYMINGKIYTKYSAWSDISKETGRVKIDITKGLI